MEPEDVETSLKDLIKESIREAFPGNSNLNRALERVKIQPYNTTDYQVNCRGIAAVLGSKDEFKKIADLIQDKIPASNPLFHKIESENGFLNIFTSESSQKKCLCKVKTNVGEQEFQFLHQENHLLDCLRENLSNTFLERDIELKKRKESTTTEVILQNFKVHMGADVDVTNVELAVQKVAERNHPELDNEKIPPIFVPKLFFQTHPQAIDMDKYPTHILEPEKRKLESQIDMTLAKELKAIEDIKEKLRNASEEEKVHILQKAVEKLRKHTTFKDFAMEFNDEHRDLLRKLKEINQLDGMSKKVQGDRAEKNFIISLRLL